MLPQSNKRPATSTLAPPAKRIQSDLNSHFVRTSQPTKELLNEKVAEFIYACNLPFSVVEHKTFKDLVTALHPGYQPTTRKALSEILLDQVHDKLQAKMKSKLEGKVVTLQQDGWSNIQNDPVIATSVRCEDEGYFVDAIDTGTTPKTAENCKEMLLESKRLAEARYGSRVKSVVTDNARNMAKMRKALQEYDPTQGCVSQPVVVR